MNRTTTRHATLTGTANWRWSLALIALAAILAASCASSAEPIGTFDASADAGGECPTITLATYDSFVLSEGTLKTFTEQTCIEVEQVAQGDAGQLVSSAILTAGNPTADVMFGIDNTFLQRGLDADLFLAYQPRAMDAVSDEFNLDERVTPINYGDVCVNWWSDALSGPAPTSLDDLKDPAYAGQFVTMNPETSSPGMAFLLATVAKYGEDGWEQYWEDLVANDVSVTAGWSDAYYGEFVAGGGDRPLVTSYASSPAAEVFYGEIDTPPTGVLLDSCFRSIEFAGILKGTKNPFAASQLVDFMLSTTYQEDIPLNMFVYPVNPGAELPAIFNDFATLADEPLTLDPDEIEENRSAWTERWTEIVLR